MAAVDPFNMGTSNNAPPPIPGGFGNPTGINTGVNKGAKTGGLFGTTAQTGLPVIGAPSMPPGISPTMPAGNAPVFSASNIQGLSSGFKLDFKQYGNLQKELSDAFGRGTGDLIYKLLTGGFFNPKVASAFLNAMQPGVNRGEADILQAFGAEGSRFGSAASLGLGDYLSNVNLNEEQTLASIFTQDQQMGLNLLESALGPLQQGQANRNKGGLLSDILGGLEAVGGAIAAPFTGGATIPLIGAGINTITGSGGGGGSGDAITKALQQILKQSKTLQVPPDPTTPPVNPIGGIPIGTSPFPDVILQGAAAGNLGGADPFANTSTGDTPDSNLLQLLILSGFDPTQLGLTNA